MTLDDYVYGQGLGHLFLRLYFTRLSVIPLLSHVTLRSN